MALLYGLPIKNMVYQEVSVSNPPIPGFGLVDWTVALDPELIQVGRYYGCIKKEARLQCMPRGRAWGLVLVGCIWRRD